MSYQVIDKQHYNIKRALGFHFIYKSLGKMTSHGCFLSFLDPNSQWTLRELKYQSQPEENKQGRPCNCPNLLP